MKNNELGIYNKYIFNNNSYLSLHIIKKTFKNNKNSNNLYQLIDDALSKSLDLRNKFNCTSTCKQKKKKVYFKQIYYYKDKSTNTDQIILNDKSTNINFNSRSNLLKSSERNLFNSNNASIRNRIKKFI